MLRKWRLMYDEASGAGSAAAEPKSDDKAEPKAEPKSESLTAEEQLLALLTPEQKALYTASLEGVKGALDKERGLNKDAKKAAERLVALEKAEEERKKAAMTELEKAQAEANEAKAQVAKAQEELYVTRVKTAIMLQASAMSFADPLDAYNLADLSGIEIGDDGQVSGVKQVLEQLAKSKPYLISRNGSQGSPKGDPNKQKVQQQVQNSAVPTVHF